MTDPKTIVVTFSENVVRGDTVNSTGFTLGGNSFVNATSTIDSIVSVTENTITLDLAGTPITNSYNVTLSYTQDANTILDTNNNALATFTNKPVANILDAIMPTTTNNATTNTPTNTTVIIPTPVTEPAIPSTNNTQTNNTATSSTNPTINNDDSITPQPIKVENNPSITPPVTRSNPTNDIIHHTPTSVRVDSLIYYNRY